MPPIPWQKIFDIILEIIAGCEKPEPAGAAAEAGDARILRQMRDPGLLQRFRLERGVRREMNLSAKEWREHGPAIMAEIYQDARDATDDELREFIAQARAAA